MRKNWWTIDDFGEDNVIADHSDVELASNQTSCLGSTQTSGASDAADLDGSAAGNHSAAATLSADGAISDDAYLTGGKWGPSGVVGTSGGTVTWSIAGAGLSYAPGNYTTAAFFTGSTVALSSFLPTDYVTQITNAFAAWSAVANINFVQVADGGGNLGVGTTTHIRICGGYIDGADNVAGRGFYAPGNNGGGTTNAYALDGDLVFDSSNTWTDQSLFGVALHEIGHTLGLSHVPQGTTAIINPTVPLGVGLQAEDIANIQALYGTRTQQVNHAPIATVADHTVNANEWAQAGNWLSYSDADGNAATRYQFWDGGTASDSGYFWTPSNAHNPAGQAIEVAASDLASVWLRGGQAGGSETMYVRAFDGTDWSAWDQFNLTTQAQVNHAPIATVADHTVNANEWAQAGNWLSYSDADGNAATRYQFWDGGTASDSGYFWTPSNAHNPAGQAIEVAASDLASVWLRGGQAGGSETMYVRAFDGTDWSAWDQFNLTTQAQVNHAPIATVADHTVNANEWAQAGNWLSYSDADGNAATRYQFWDGGTASDSGYFWTPSNAHNPAGQAIEVAASDLASVWLRGGQAGGSETMYVRAFDGTDWSAWDQFNLTTQAQVNHAPIATVADHTVNANEWAQAGNWLSYSDADGNAATRYQFWDGGTASDSGYFWTPSNAHNPAGQAIEVAASDLASVWLRGGQAGGSETMYVRAFDGTDWSAWDQFNLTTQAQVNQAPIATIGDHTLANNQWSRVDSWISYSDANGNAATQYQFWDGGAGADSGYFWTPDNAHNPADTAITVAAADLSSVWLRGGAADGSETMYVRAFDGSDWSTWDAFTFLTV